MIEIKCPRCGKISCADVSSETLINGQNVECPSCLYNWTYESAKNRLLIATNKSNINVDSIGYNLLRFFLVLFDIINLILTVYVLPKLFMLGFYIIKNMIDPEKTSSSDSLAMMTAIPIFMFSSILLSIYFSIRLTYAKKNR